MHRRDPAKFLEAGADDAAGDPELTFDQQAHGHRAGVPAARDQPAKATVRSRLRIEVERLRIEQFGKRCDLALVNNLVAEPKCCLIARSSK